MNHICKYASSGCNSPEGECIELCTKDSVADSKPDEQLCKFYGVTTYAELVAAQARHIEKLQAKVTPLRDEQAGKARFA